MVQARDGEPTYEVEPEHKYEHTPDWDREYVTDKVANTRPNPKREYMPVRARECVQVSKT